jgi:hypothetical protein
MVFVHSNYNNLPLFRRLLLTLQARHIAPCVCAMASFNKDGGPALPITAGDQHLQCRALPLFPQALRAQCDVGST